MWRLLYSHCPDFCRWLPRGGHQDGLPLLADCCQDGCSQTALLLWAALWVPLPRSWLLLLKYYEENWLATTCSGRLWTGITNSIIYVWLFYILILLTGSVNNIMQVLSSLSPHKLNDQHITDTWLPGSCQPVLVESMVTARPASACWEQGNSTDTATCGTTSGFTISPATQASCCCLHSSCPG